MDAVLTMSVRTAFFINFSETHQNNRQLIIFITIIFLPLQR